MFKQNRLIEATKISQSELAAFKKKQTAAEERRATGTKLSPTGTTTSRPGTAPAARTGKELTGTLKTDVFGGQTPETTFTTQAPDGRSLERVAAAKPSVAPQQAAGVQTTSNVFGSQRGGPGVPSAAPVPGQAVSGAPGTTVGADVGQTAGGIQLGTGAGAAGGIAGIFQPGLDVIGKGQQTLEEGLQLQFDQLNKSFQDQMAIAGQQEEQALAGLQFDPATGTFTGLSGTEESRIRTPFEESMEAQRLQAQGQLQDVEFAKSQSLEALATEKRRTEKTLESQKLARETFAGLAGAFGSSRTFEFMQEKETEGLEILNEIDTKVANFSQYYGDKVQGVKDVYNLNVQSLRNNMTQELNDRYLGLTGEVDKIRNDKVSSIQQKELDMRAAIQTYNTQNNDLFAKGADIMTEFNKMTFESEQQIAAEDEVLRDTIGGAILDTYDTLVPGFVPSEGKIEEFTRTIYEGIALYEDTGGAEGFPNLQAGLGELMTAIKSNESVFGKFNPAQQPTGGGGAGGGTGEFGGDFLKDLFLGQGVNPTKKQLKDAEALIGFGAGQASQFPEDLPPGVEAGLQAGQPPFTQQDVEGVVTSIISGEAVRPKLSD